MRVLSASMPSSRARFLRIEGVSVDPSRVQSVLIVSKPLFRDRDEEEIRGYRDALAWIHDHSSEISLDESTLKRLHAMTRGQIWDAIRGLAAKLIQSPVLVRRVQGADAGRHGFTGVAKRNCRFGYRSFIIMSSSSNDSSPIRMTFLSIP